MTQTFFDAAAHRPGHTRRTAPQAIAASLRPTAMAVHLACAAMAAVWAFAPAAYAQAAGAAATVNADVPAGSLADALNRFALQAGVVIAVDADRLKGKTTPGLKGAVTVEEGFRRLLEGSGYQVGRTSAGFVLVAAAPVPTTVAPARPSNPGSEATLPAVRVTAGAEAPTARGNGEGTEYVSPVVQAGLLGDRPAVEVPFTIQSYTRDLIEQQQSRTLADVLKYDATTVNHAAIGSHASAIDIRGFSIYGSGVSWDGIAGAFGIVYESTPLDLTDAVEVMKGPSALLFGAGDSSPLGSVNYVPKRPPQAAGSVIRRAGVSVQTGGAITANADIGGRFGAGSAFGYRVNVFGKGGETAVDHLKVEETGVLASIDWRVHPAFKVTADIATLNHVKKGHTTGSISLAPGLSVPRTPDGDVNVAMPWGYTEADRDFALLKAEWEFQPNWKATLATTYTKAQFGYLNAAGVLVTDDQGNGTISGLYSEDPNETVGRTQQATVQGKIKTGAVQHELILGYTRNTMKNEYTTVNYAFPVYSTNIYRPTYYPSPALISKDASVLWFDNTNATTRVIDIMSWGPWVAMLGLGRVTMEAELSEYDKSKTTPLAALLYKLDPSTSVYASYAEGFQRGGTAPVLTPAGAPVVNAREVMPPVVSDQFEVGFKKELGQVQLAASLFRINKSLEYLAGDRYVQDGVQRHTGIELSATGRVTRDVNVIASAMLLRATVNNGAVNGKEPSAVPERGLSLYANWSLPVYRPLSVSAGVQYRSGQWLDLANTQKIGGYTVFDLGASLDTRAAFNVPAQLRLTVNNVAERAYWATASYASLNKGAPRTVILSAAFDF